MIAAERVFLCIQRTLTFTLTFDFKSNDHFPKGKKCSFKKSEKSHLFKKKVERKKSVAFF